MLNQSTQVFQRKKFTITKVPASVVNDTVITSRGEHSQIYHIHSSENLVSGYENNQLLLKCYFAPTTVGNALNAYLRNSLEQYDQVIKANLPVAKILNRETIETDGYFLVENIPHVFDFTWDEATPFESLDATTQSRLSQLKNFFRLALEHNIALDLKKDNLSVRDDGTVVLIDLREDEEEEFSHVLNHHLCSFAEGKEHVYRYLDPRANK